jgi:aryl-alcohol dehydrogenase-like predicted oxidoreductase
VLKNRRHEYVLASKCGIFKDENGKRLIDGRPEILRKTCEDSLRRLQTDVIDLYYLHRWDQQVPIEDSVGALAGLVQQGKIKTIGLSECSAATLRKAHAVHPITALQTEYSLWTRNPEIAVLKACRELGVTFVAFSPLARGFLTGALRDANQLADNDLRRSMPRFQGENFVKNLRLLDAFVQIAKEVGCTPSQLALAWVLAQGEDIIPIPGTRHVQYVEENAGAVAVELSDEILSRLHRLINQHTVSGGRYSAATQAEIDTEEF